MRQTNVDNTATEPGPPPKTTTDFRRWMNKGATETVHIYRNVVVVVVVISHVRMVYSAMCKYARARSTQTIAPFNVWKWKRNYFLLLSLCLDFRVILIWDFSCEMSVLHTACALRGGTTSFIPIPLNSLVYLGIWVSALALALTLYLSSYVCVNWQHQERQILCVQWDSASASARFGLVFVGFDTMRAAGKSHSYCRQYGIWYLYK